MSYTDRDYDYIKVEKKQIEIWKKKEVKTY